MVDSFGGVSVHGGLAARMRPAMLTTVRSARVRAVTLLPALPPAGAQPSAAPMSPMTPPRSAIAAALHAPPPLTAPPPSAPPPLDAAHMVWVLARLSFAQPLRTFAVALGKLASQAGTTYTALIGPRLLVSRQVRVQDAFLTIGLTMGGNLLQLLEADWEIALERHFQNTMVPWLGQRRSNNVPHDAATFDALGKLTLERSTQWVQAAGLVGRLGSSLYAAMGNAHQLPRSLLAVMIGVSVLRHGLGAWWARHIQQRVTDWTLQRGRSTYALLRGVGAGVATDVSAEETRLSNNRTARLQLTRAGIGVETVQETLLLAAGYGMFWRLGWFSPHAPLETLVAAQTAMAAAQSLVAAILMIPLFAVGQSEMHARVGTYLRAAPETA